MNWLNVLIGKKKVSKCICVVGMHRSGTSCLTGIMQGIGVELGEVFTENLFNKRGNRENNRITTLNHAVLVHNQGDWNRPVLAKRWTSKHAQERDAIIAELSGRTDTYWGFKDPRVLFTLDFWLERLESPDFVGTYRHPHRVALSLQNRDNTPFEQSWNLWLVYNRRLLELARRYRFAMVDFDAEPEAYLEEVISALIGLGLDESQVDRGREFFDAKLRNQAKSRVDDVALPSEVSALYAELLDYKKRYQA
ncbi:MAG: hypothetical protein ACR2P6_02335 [Gammaproteobacteria bacterium]